MSIVTCRSHLSCKVPWRVTRPSDTSMMHYVGGSTGSWRVDQIKTFSGPELASVTHLEIVGGHMDRVPQGATWVLPGVVSSTRYIAREEPRRLEPSNAFTSEARTPSAALVLIRKSEEWWNLAGETRQDIIEARSRQIDARLRRRQPFARRLTLQRDASHAFDFLTWFEFDAKDATLIDELSRAIRATDEWNYVEREIEIRLSKQVTRPR